MTASRRTLVEWIQDRVSAGQGGDDANNMDERTTIEEAELEDMGLQIGRRGGEELARWIE